MSSRSWLWNVMFKTYTENGQDKHRTYKTTEMKHKLRTETLEMGRKQKGENRNYIKIQK